MQVKDYQEQVARLKEQQEFAIKDTDEQIHKWLVDDNVSTMYNE